MTTYNWSALTNGQIVPFVPGSDVINFDDSTNSAADLNWSFGDTSSASDPNGNFTLILGSKTVKFGIVATTPAPFDQITTTNITFADGSKFIVGDNLLNFNDDLPNTLTGGNGDDALFGLGGNDTMTGGLGNDNFWVGYSTVGIGNDSIDGGAGFDSLIYNSSSTTAARVNLSGTFNVIAAHTANNAQGVASLVSIETVLGTSVADTFIGGDPAHAIDGLGNRTTERFRGNAGNDTITGGGDLTPGDKGINFYTIADYSNNSAAQAVNANLFTGVVSDGRSGTDTLINVDGFRGGAGGDVLTGGSLSRSPGGTFFESFRGNAGNDTIDGGNSHSDGDIASTDRVEYSGNTSAQAVNVNLATGVAVDGLGGTDTLIDINQVYGGAGNDTLIGDANNNSFDGDVGNDTIDGGAGSDTVEYQQSTAGVIVNLSGASITVNSIVVTAGTANDGMGGTDTLINIESARGSDFNDYLRGSDDVTVKQFFRGDAGNDTIDGGAGIDFANYSSNSLTLGGLNAFIENGSGTVNDKMGGIDTLINIEGLAGTNGNDTLTGGLGDQWFRGNGGNDSINGGSGSDWVNYGNDPTGVTINLLTGTATDGWNGPTGLLALGGTDTLVSIENAEGSNFADNITGGSDANELRGLVGNDSLNGGAGNDTLNGGSGNDVLNGGADIDTAIFTGAFRKYALSGNPGVTGTLSGPDGVDTLSSVEKLQFIDGFRSYDSGAHIWQIERLYGSAFARQADVLGLNYHSGRLDAGTALNTVAQDFANSAEFIANYGSLNNSGYVSQLYLNVLHRTADAGGLSYWSGQLNSGAMTRGEVLGGFSESAEQIGNYAGQLAGGLWDIDESSASVARLYMGTFGRAPDVGGLDYWGGQLKSGAQTLQQEAGFFVSSAEFQATYGSLNNGQFVSQLYVNVLHRAADAGGLGYWTGQLDGGVTRADVTVGFTESAENQVTTIGSIDNGIAVL